MPRRSLPLVNEEIYHVFNRGINRQPTFISLREYQRALLSIEFYRVFSPPTRLSKFLQLNRERQEQISHMMAQANKLIEILCFCLMPNHFHFLLKQKKEDGISKFLANFQNSYTRYFNTRNNRDGSLFLDQFKARRIETSEQLIHISRYIHLNPYTGYVVKSLPELENYLWSSFPKYLSEETNFIESGLILDFFENKIGYKQFVFDQADYQRSLKEIEHLSIE